LLIKEQERIKIEGILMKIKIIKNTPSINGASDISKYIGQIFNAQYDGDGDVSITEGKLYAMTIFYGEYEIVEE